MVELNKDIWQLKNTGNVNQLLRIKKETNLKKFPNLVILKHSFHIADDIMFPDPSCLAFFTAFEKNHIEKLENEDLLELCAVDIKEGLMQFFIYCDDYEKAIEKLILFLKTNSLYSCDFEVLIDDKGSRLNSLI